MAYPRTIRNVNVFLDGQTYFGRASTVTLPELAINMVEHRGAGMDVPAHIDMGQQAMRAEMSFAEWSPALFRQWGAKPPLVLRPAAMGQNDFSADSYVVSLRGAVQTLAPQQITPGQDAPLNLTFAVDYLRLEINGEEVIEIDAENGRRIVAGVDQLAEMRRAMGV